MQWLCRRILSLAEFGTCSKRRWQLFTALTSPLGNQMKWATCVLSSPLSCSQTAGRLTTTAQGELSRSGEGLHKRMNSYNQIKCNKILYEPVCVSIRPYRLVRRAWEQVLRRVLIGGVVLMLSLPYPCPVSKSVLCIRLSPSVNSILSERL